MNTSEEEPCPICWEVPTIPFSIPCKHVFCYLCIKRVAEDRKPCPICNSIIPDFVLEKAKISDEVIDLKEVSCKWMYSGRNYGWWYYSQENDSVIEDVWKIYQTFGQPESFTINVLGRNYKIDLREMTQECTSTGVTRNIKRLELQTNNSQGEILIKGISGIQVVKKNELPEMPKAEWGNPKEYTFQPAVWEDDESDYESSI